MKKITPLVRYTDRNLIVKNEKIDMDYGEDLEGRARMRMTYTCKHPEIHQWPFSTLSKWETVEWNEEPRDFNNTDGRYPIH